MIQRTFRKCGISVPIDGSADGDIQLEGLADYTYKRMVWIMKETKKMKTIWKQKWTTPM